MPLTSFLKSVNSQADTQGTRPETTNLEHYILLLFEAESPWRHDLWRKHVKSSQKQNQTLKCIPKNKLFGQRTSKPHTVSDSNHLLKDRHSTYEKRNHQSSHSCFCHPCTPRASGDHLPGPDFLHRGSSLRNTAVSNSYVKGFE